jgi:DNA-directed RNA polymerase subunit RPC12/RpoP
MRARGTWAKRRYHGTLEGPRLRGVCAICQGRHRWPDTRYACTSCGKQVCGQQIAWQGLNARCPECGGRVESVEGD